jgi:hypothetical protein
MQIGSQLEYDATMILIQDMSGAPEDTPEERLLIRLVLSVEIWEASHTKLGKLPERWSQNERA